MTNTIAQVTSLFTTASLAAAGAAAVSIPIAIHLLTRLRRRPMAWGAMQFLYEAFKQQRRRLQLEQWLLLLVRCLIVFVLGVALSEPLLGSWAQWLGVEPQGRTVHIVIDDSLSSRIEDANGQARFEAFREAATDMVSSLSANDRLAIWRTARPAENITAPALVDSTSARQLLDSLKPRYGQSELSSVLTRIDEQLKQEQVDPEQAVVMILSDFAGDTFEGSQGRANSLGSLGKSARLLISPPATSTTNVQVSNVTLRRRRVILSQGSQRSLPVQVNITRYNDNTADTLASVKLQLLLDEQSPAIAEVDAEHRWSLGQQSTTLNMQLPLTSSKAVGRLIVRASVDSGTMNDSLPDDNHRSAVVQVRREMNVLLVTDRTVAADESYTVRDLVSLALTPISGAMQVNTLLPEEVTVQSLQTVDAVILLRGDLLGDQGANAVRQFTERGGLLWIMPPVDRGTAVWMSDLLGRLGLPWRAQVEHNTVDDETGAGLSLVISDKAPEPLQLLGADWPDLQRPVRVSEWIELTSEAGGTQQQAGSDIWLRLANEQNSPLLLEHAVGMGQVLLLTTAPHPDWTNLPTKPLFVPLLHESLRSLMGNPAESRQLANLQIGDQPTLNESWQGTQQLRSDSGLRIGVSSSLQTAEPMLDPLVFRARPETVGQMLAVNLAPVAGNTATFERQQIAGWLAGETHWNWLDETTTSAALAQKVSNANLGWHLLWVLLGLVILETFMARWFSHAKTGGRSWGKLIADWIRHHFRSHPA